MTSKTASLNKSRWPSWGGNPENLWVGLEEEHFITDVNGRAPSLELTKQFFEELVRFGFVAKSFDVDGRPLGVNKDTGKGYLSIKNDFCTHIIEVAFAPEQHPIKMSDTVSTTWELIAKSASNVGLSVKGGGAIEQLPEGFELVPHPRREWLPSRPKPSESSYYWHKYFNILMCSAQVHLNILEEGFYKCLPAYYSLDYLIPLGFSNSPSSKFSKVHCLRPLLWKDSFVPEYRAFAFPAEIPNTEEGYKKLIAGSHDFQRDYSFVAPREFGSVEFRSGCAQDSLSDTLALAALRIAIAIVVNQGLIVEDSSAAKRFYDVCISGQAPVEKLNSDLDILSSAAVQMPVSTLR